MGETLETVEDRIARLRMEISTLKFNQNYGNGYSMEARRDMMDRRKRLTRQLNMLLEAKALAP